MSVLEMRSKLEGMGALLKSKMSKKELMDLLAVYEANKNKDTDLNNLTIKQLMLLIELQGKKDTIPMKPKKDELVQLALGQSKPSSVSSMQPRKTTKSMAAHVIEVPIQYPTKFVLDEEQYKSLQSEELGSALGFKLNDMRDREYIDWEISNKNLKVLGRMESIGNYNVMANIKITSSLYPEVIMVLVINWYNPYYNKLDKDGYRVDYYGLKKSREDESCTTYLRFSAKHIENNRHMAALNMIAWGAAWVEYYIGERLTVQPTFGGPIKDPAPSRILEPSSQAIMSIKYDQDATDKARKFIRSNFLKKLKEYRSIRDVDPFFST